MNISLEWIYDNTEYKQEFSSESATSSVIEVLESMVAVKGANLAVIANDWS